MAAPRITAVTKVDESRVVAKPTILREIGEKLSSRVEPIILPAFQREIRRKLGKTRTAHKFTNVGSMRSPLARGGSGPREAHGSKTERQAFVSVDATRASGAGGGRGARGATYNIQLGSTTRTHDRRLFTLPLLIFGRTGRGTLTRRVSFWGRRGNEGKVTVSKFRHVTIPSDEGFIERVLTSRIMQRTAEAFRNIVNTTIQKDQLRSFVEKYMVEITI